MSQIEGSGSSREDLAETAMASVHGAPSTPCLSSWAALLILALVYGAVLTYIVSPFLFHGQSLYIADVTYNFAPAANFIGKVFQAEHGFTLMKPLWNPYLLCGAPQVAVAWPLAYLPGYAACFLDGAKGQAFLIFFHLFVAGIGGYVWFSKYDERRESDGGFFTKVIHLLTGPAALFGFMFMLSGYMLGSSINLSLLFSVCWTPFALTLIDRLAAAPRVAFTLTALLAFVLAQQFGAGRPEMFLGEGILYLFYALMKVAELAPDRSRAAMANRFMLELLAAMLLSLAYNAANILPMIEAVKCSPHLPKFDPSDALNWSAGWFEYLEILFMQPLGELNMAHYSLYPTYPNSMAYVTSLFLGAPVLVLAFIGTGDSSWKQKAFWLWMIVLFVLISLGEFVPFWKPLYEAIPSINLLRFPVKQTVFIELAIIALAARGWYLVLKGDVARKDFVGGTIFWGIFFAVGLLIFYSTTAGNMQALGVVMSMSSGCDDLNLAREAAIKLAAHIFIAGFTGFATCLALANLKGAWEPFVRVCVVVLIVSSLVINGRMQLWHTVDCSFFTEPSTILQTIRSCRLAGDTKGACNAPATDLKGAAPATDQTKILSLFHHPIAVPQKVLDAPAGQMDKEFMRYARNILAPNTNIDQGIFMLSGMPVLPDWATVFMETGILPRSSVRAELTHDAGKSDVPLYKWCQATATKYIMCPIGTQSAEDLLVRDSKLLDAHYFKVAAEDKQQNVRIYEVSPTRKRVQLFANATMAETRIDALKHINRCDSVPYDPLTESILNEPDQPSALSFESKPPPLDRALMEKVLHGQSINHPGEATIIADDRERVIMNAKANVPAVLVFADSYYPGWKAFDNGQPAHILLADGLMKAILLEPGEHQVVFQYIPGSYVVGLRISLFTLAALLGLILGGIVLTPVIRARRREIIHG